MTTEVAKIQSDIIEQVLIKGDLASLTAEQRVIYYNKVCASLGLNPLTRPFNYITLNGKLTLYAMKDCTEQLRRVHKISLTVSDRSLQGDVFLVTAHASTPEGRTDESIGAITVAGLKGDALANAYMKAETKAKRRITLSICGLGMLDETEAENIPQKNPLSEKEIRDFYDLAKSSGIFKNREDLKKYLAEEFQVEEVADLNFAQYERGCTYFRSKMPKEPGSEG